MRQTVATLIAALLTTAVASAQSYPGDSGIGVERGIQQLNNSGQVGTVTLFGHGTSTAAVVRLHGVPPGRAQRAGVYRTRDCTSIPSKPEFTLGDVRNGLSRSIGQVSEDRLLSGNYSVVVYASAQPGAPPTACGWLYAS
ncbi:MAG TPA: hypothetical protein VE591_06335 [Candidatus Acidoferrum sp.]|nr:hypothetical protein [Candidatus Acidoferrum sp.]